jgi:integrase
VVHEEVQRLLGLSAGTMQLRRREVRLVARDCARQWLWRRAHGVAVLMPDEAELVEQLVNGFRGRGLVLDGDHFPLAREVFCRELAKPRPVQSPAEVAPPPISTTIAGWVALRSLERPRPLQTQQAWQRELQLLLAFSRVSMPAAVSSGAAWRWRNHIGGTVALSTARRRLGLIRGFYADACRQGIVERNPFAGQPPLQATSLPSPALDPLQLRQLDLQRSDDPLYQLVRLLGLRSGEAAGLRPLDLSLEAGLPVVWIRSWGTTALGRPCRASQQRCLPLPKPLQPFWEEQRGSATEPIWPQHCSSNADRAGYRWAVELRRTGFCSAPQLRAERQRQWRGQGADWGLLQQLLGGSSTRLGGDESFADRRQRLERLLAWLEMPV